MGSNKVKRCLIVFAKEPKEGNSKTRLQPCLSPSECRELYEAFLRDTVNLAKRVICEKKILAYESPEGRPGYLKQIAPHFKFYRQKGGDLGSKMHSAFKLAENGGLRKIVLIGSDAPTLPSDYINRAFEQLNKSDVVIGPSSDGGYYLIGLREPCLAVFKGVKWSSHSVSEDTVKKAKEAGKNVSLLKEWYDVDDVKSLAHLKRDLKRNKSGKDAKWTRKFLKI